MNGKLIERVKDLLCFFGAVSLIAICAIVLTPIPEVHVSYSTGECVKMITVDGVEQSCPAQLPKRYNHVFVK